MIHHLKLRLQFEWRNLCASIASRYLTGHRVQTERERIRARVREICIDAGRPIPKALR